MDWHCGIEQNVLVVEKHVGDVHGDVVRDEKSSGEPCIGVQWR
jgi:hypothetical protein